MALTRIGIGGPMAAYPEFEPTATSSTGRIIDVVAEYATVIDVVAEPTTAIDVVGEGKMRG